MHTIGYERGIVHTKWYSPNEWLEIMQNEALPSWEWALVLSAAETKNDLLINGRKTRGKKKGEREFVSRVLPDMQG